MYTTVLKIPCKNGDVLKLKETLYRYVNGTFPIAPFDLNSPHSILKGIFHDTATQICVLMRYLSLTSMYILQFLINIRTYF